MGVRVVSLVPSLTEAVAVSAPPGTLVGATDWCSHPAELGDGVMRIGGTKNPDTGAVAALRPDLVIANEEENRGPDLEALRAAGIEVLVTEVRGLEQAFGELERVLLACGVRGRPGWLDAAEAAWAGVGGAGAGVGAGAGGSEGDEPPRTAVVPIWRRPWMVLGRDTFAGDLLARLGVRNLYADHPERYPKVPLDELRAAAPELVVLPDEPYRFTRDDGPEAFPGTAAALVDGRHLTWYGPSLAEAPRVLRAALRSAAPARS
ncbi:helical backbone metal receptor [Streptomyces sp. SKN60]|uniref:helical backbone metal receptor n=1 Tax=Streptomyces sp. SKN60 TaxID=2855506 RepID=UPI002245CC70|nr:helical backbone metal receptor [Streptomyces sp. SKN60]MCX2182473.1 helical backbone metal receptor [Streptomyces sp. SKN60]